MLPQIFGESAAQEAERQSNYLILRTLEQRLPQGLFAQVLAEVSQKSEDDTSKPSSERAMVLPQRVCWDGSKVECTFSDLKVSQRNLDDAYLPRVLLTMQELQKIQQCRASQLSIQQSLSKILNRNIDQKCKKTQNLAIQLRSKIATQIKPSRRALQKNQVGDYSRMKTVFCHADFTTDEVSSIFNVQFDQTGRFIISGADDGVIKVWDRETLTLQASLHGHFDYITDIDISKCNRFIASSGKDAQIIIWDLKSGKIVKKLTQHQQLINRIQFVTPKIKKTTTPVQSTEKTSINQVNQQNSINELQTQFKQMSIDNQNFGPEVFQVQDQFLLSCSDDGTVRLYDFSPLSRNDPMTSQDGSKNDIVSQESEELRIRRSMRRPGDVRNNGPPDPYADVTIFEIELTPDDFRPGQRNKKLDTLGCSSQGLVVAGTNSGELFVWKVNFAEVQKQNSFSASKFLGQFKIQKHGGIQYLEFSPKSDLLLLGSTDGSVRILDFSLPSNRKSEDSELKKFTLAENNRLYLSISEMKGCQKYNSLKFYNEEGEEEEQISVIEKTPEQYPNLGPKKHEVFVKSTCDAVKWSVHGRYAIASITSKVEKPADALPEDPHEEICRIKIWDMVDEQFYEDLAKPSGFLIKRNSWVLAPHPRFEEILLTGSDGGQLILWNIKTKQLLQTFKQYGVYSIDQYVMDNPLIGVFSKDGHSFIIGQQLGTISLFSNERITHQYEATRVQQFFPYDSAKHQENPFEKMQNHPQLCGYNMIPYEVQPTKPLIGRVAHAKIAEERQIVKSIDQKAKESHDFERNLILAKELGQMEEKYYQDQIQMCIQQDLFVPGVLDEGTHPQAGRIDSIAVSSIDIGDQEFALNSVRDDSVYDYMPYNASPQVARPSVQASQINIIDRRQLVTSAQQPNRRPRLQRSQIQDRQEVVDSNEQSEELVTNHQQDSQFEEEDYSISSDDDDVSDEETKFQGRRTNIHDRNARHQNRQENQRAQRRVPQRNFIVEESDEELDCDTRRRGRHRRKQSDSDEFDSDDKEIINMGRSTNVNRINGRGRPIRHAAIQAQTQLQSSQPNGESRRRLFRNYNQNSQENDEEFQRRRNLRQPRNGSARRTSRDLRLNNARTINESQSSESSSEGRHTRNTRRRPDLEIQDTVMKNNSEEENSHDEQIRMDGFYLSDREENKKYQQEDEEESEEVTVYKQKDIENAIMQVQSDQMQDRDFKFICDKNEQKNILATGVAFNQICAFCNRADAPLIGPFCRFDENRDSQNLGCQPLFFHRDCIEINKFAKFSQTEKTWVNIGTALLYLIFKYPQECWRCKTKGATTSCVSCKRWFHGFKCVSQYSICIDTAEAKNFQCLYCRNFQNFQDYVNARDCRKKNSLSPLEWEVKTLQSTYLQEIKLLEREHLFSYKNPLGLEHDNKKVFTYNPQVGDLVYYFFQGHEDFITQYSCHFFSGLSSNFPQRKFTPWTQKNKSPIRKERFVLCKVLQVDSLFPSKREINLMRKFGSDSTTVNQTPQIIQQVKLQVMRLTGLNAKMCISASEKNPTVFTVDIFTNELPEFLILQPIFEQRLKWYLDLRKESSQGIVGKTLKISTKKGIKTVKITKEFDPLEPSLFAQSLWKNIKCVDVFSGRGGRSSVSEMPQHRSSRRENGIDTNIDEIRISFWEILFNQELQSKAQLEKNLNAFNGDQQEKLENALTSFLQQKSEFLYIFRERVKESDAPDYRSIIASEMYFDLIMQRIKNGYYRSQEEIESDLDKISYNAILYNGTDNVIAQNAQKLCETFRMRIKQMVFQKQSDLLEDHLEQALSIIKLANAELVFDQKEQNVALQIDFKQIEAQKHIQSKVTMEIVQSEEEEKKELSGKRAVRPFRNRVIENSAGSENKVQTPTSNTQKSRKLSANEDIQMQQQNEVIINTEENQASGPNQVNKEKASQKISVFANVQNHAQSAPSTVAIVNTNEQFVAPQNRGPGQTRKRMRHELETPVQSDRISPSPSRPISDEQESRIRAEGMRNGAEQRVLRKRQRVE